ncbi:E3 ubiquitin-protein ligase SIRP1-like [Lotus japonicus]|uniref:E3 ubiquitin-protein ligase SIRP1-like n=1 Tax=Lotus japonicus TaxID=34305 RepID=UPI0025862981|nr:E3 ubiquitin-protein ligase SIRP1-like [Lotus japonicus]
MDGEQWCNTCSKMVKPIFEAENKCPFCGTELITEAMGSISDQNDAIDLRSAWVFSLYAPIFLGLMGAFSPSLAIIGAQESSTSREDEPERDNELILGRRRRASTYMLHIFRSLHVGMVSESENMEDNNRNIDGSSILVIDPFNEGGALIVRGSGFDLLLQHLAHIGPSGYASVNPPAQKVAIEAMPSVTNDEKFQCTICLEDLEIGIEAKEMPCKHKFHGDCIISWLKLHSSCPVCRFQIPSEDSSSVEASLGIRNGENQNSELAGAREERTRYGRRNWFPVLQSFNNFLPSP